MEIFIHILHKQADTSFEFICKWKFIILYLYNEIGNSFHHVKGARNAAQT